MNILYLAHRIPFPPNKGDKLRAFRQLKHLSRSHCVWCACFVDTPSDTMCIGPLASYCNDLAAIPLNRTLAAVRGLRNLVFGGTVTEGFYRVRAMQNLLRDWSAANPFDVVVAFSSSMAPYALRVRAARRILDLCDVDSAKWLDYSRLERPPMKWLHRAESRRLARLEEIWGYAFDAVTVISEAEAALIRDRLPPGRLHVVTNGVDLPGAPLDRPPSATENAPPVLSPRHRGRRTIGFVGVMDYRPSVDAVTWFVRECWPVIRKRFPDVEFRIVGRNPTQTVRDLTQTPGVFVVGEVPLVSPELEAFHVFVAPLRLGRGIANKVLEAFAHARPSVLTPIAARGLDIRDREHALIAETPDEFARRVCDLLADEELGSRLGAAARRYVADHHDWNRQLAIMERVVEGSENASDANLPLKLMPDPVADIPPGNQEPLPVSTQNEVLQDQVAEP